MPRNATGSHSELKATKLLIPSPRLLWYDVRRRSCRAHAMKYCRGALALAAVACLSTAASAQQHPDVSGLWTRGGAADTPLRPPPSAPGPVTTLRLPGQSLPRLA